MFVLLNLTQQVRFENTLTSKRNVSMFLSSKNTSLLRFQLRQSKLSTNTVRSLFSKKQESSNKFHHECCEFYFVFIVTPSVFNTMVPSSYVARYRTENARKRLKTSSCGCPYRLFFPAEMIASSGVTARNHASLVDVCDP